MSDEEVKQINHDYQMVVRNLNQHAWDIMLPSEKIHSLQAIENKNAMDQNRIACEVTAEPMEKGYMGYQTENRIVINRNELDNPDFIEHVDTIFHEGSHARDFQAQYFSEVRDQYASREQIAERNTLVPNPDVYPREYWNHPGEIAAREAGEKGVEKVMDDRQYILDVDRQMAEASPIRNQILQTYDYDAFDIPDRETSMFETTEEASPSQYNGMSTEISEDMGENGHGFSESEDFGSDFSSDMGMDDF